MVWELPANTCLFESNTLLKGQLNTRWQFHVQINLISTGTEKCTSHVYEPGSSWGQVSLFPELQGEFADRYEFTISLILATS